MTDTERDARYDVVWDGRVVDDAPHDAPSLNRRKHNVSALVAAVLRAQTAPLTMREIAAVAGCGERIANGGLHALGKQGRLGHRERPGTWAPRLQRPLWEYWLLPEGA